MSFPLQNVEDSILDLLELISGVSDVGAACLCLEEYLSQFGYTLLSVKFCDSEDELPAIRSFGNYPCEIKELSEKLRETGGCPMTQEAIRLLRPFDALAIEDVRYPDFLSRRFLQEIRKTGHSHIAVVPVSLNRGIALFSIGLGEETFTGKVHDFLIATISQTTIFLLTKFPELSQLFVPKVLNPLQSHCLMLHANGANEKQIGHVLKISEFTVQAVLNSCMETLNAHNRAHAAVKAVRLGEFIDVI